MTGWPPGDGLVPAGALVLAAILLSGGLTGLRTALASASLAGGSRLGLASRVPLTRVRLLGGLRVGATALAVAAATGASWTLGTRFGPVAVAWAGIGTALLVVYAEAAALSAPGQALVRRLLRPLGLEAGTAASLSGAEELRDQVDFLHQHGGVRKEDRDMLGGLLDLKDLTVSEVMVHRTRMRTLDVELPADELVREVLASPHTRMPLYRDGPDNIVGVLHAKDLFRARAEGRVSSVEALATLPWFVPEATTLRDQLRAFLARRQHFALVVDEYGDLKGLVTLEDILEEIVGEISDEHDVAARGVRPQPDGSVLADGAVPIRDLNRMMDWHLPDDEATTVAGLVIHEAMTIPDTGQVFNFHGFRFEVLRRARNRVTALRIAPMGPRAAFGV